MAWVMTALALRRCGAKPVRIRPSSTVDETKLDALVIGGGTDVDPFHYGEEGLQDDAEQRAQSNTLLEWIIGLLLALLRIVLATHKSQDYDPARDAMEKHLIDYALQHDLPVLGICRGAQLMNVVLGGTLYQNIDQFYTEETSNVRSVLPRKNVIVPDDCRLHEILGCTDCRVNALHNQSIKDLGRGVTVCARERSSVIQAIELTDHRYYVGVQWHPEYMPQSRGQQKLFRCLVESAQSAAGTSPATSAE
tara:strand:+ start:36152 stop:36901 length:750 start_codon:yes stop_codon:yes gene_type:complete